MSSLLTNESAMTALLSLRETDKSLQATQARIATGLRVGSAKDNAAYWSIATTMKSDNSALSTVKEALGFGSALVDVAYTATNSSIDLVKEIKNKLVAARQPGIDRAKIQSEITQLQSQLQGVSESAVFSGQNWLSVDSSDANYNATKSIVASFNRASDGTVAVATIDFDIAGSVLYDANGNVGILDKAGTASTVAIADIDISALTDSAADLAVLDTYITDVDTGLQSMTTSASDLGAIKQRISLQTDFVSNLMDAVDRGVGQLIEADMTKESTRLQALQVQKQLGIQALSIANQDSQSILGLFRG